MMTPRTNEISNKKSNIYTLMQKYNYEQESPAISSTLFIYSLNTLSSNLNTSVSSEMFIVIQSKVAYKMHGWVMSSDLV